MGSRIAGIFLLTWSLAACASAPSSHAPTPTPAAPSATGRDDCAGRADCRARPARDRVFDAAAVPEASGVARSGRDPDVLWLVDDREGASELWAVRPDGSLVRLPVAGMTAVNAEALAQGPCAPDDDASCLYVGDIGDNTAARSHVRVVRVREPDLAAMPAEAAGDAVALRYPDGARDAEALLVDGDGVPWILSKATFDAAAGVTGPTRLYAAPGFRDGVLLDLGVVPVPEPPTPVVTLLYGNTVTGADHVPGRVLVRTYDQIVEYVAPSPDADLATLASWPHGRVATPWQPQAEAVAYAADGCGYFSVSEGSGEVWLVPCAGRTDARATRDDSGGDA